jgi:hypothetical protein
MTPAVRGTRRGRIVRFAVKENVGPGRGKAGGLGRGRDPLLSGKSVDVI